MDIKEVYLDGPMFSDGEEKTYARSVTNFVLIIIMLLKPSFF